MDEAVFLQILNNLLEKARKKKNELDYSDINDAFKGFEFDEDKMEDVYEFLEAKNIDIINIPKHGMTMMSSSIIRKKKLNCWMMLTHWKV